MTHSCKKDIICYIIQTRASFKSIAAAKQATTLKELENIMMSDRAYPYYSNCCTCWYCDRDYNKKCSNCKDGSNYTFPYGYWKTIKLREERFASGK